MTNGQNVWSYSCICWMEEWGSVVLTFFEHPHFLWDVTKSLPDLQSPLDVVGMGPLALAQPADAARIGRGRQLGRLDALFGR